MEMVYHHILQVRKSNRDAKSERGERLSMENEGLRYVMDGQNTSGTPSALRPQREGENFLTDHMRLEKEQDWGYVYLKGQHR